MNFVQLTMNKILPLLTASLLGGLCLSASAQSDKTTTTDPHLATSRAIDIYRSVLGNVSTLYVDTFDMEKVTAQGLNMTLSQLDPYTNFFPETDRADFAFMTTGEYGGIGAYILQVDSVVYVREPMPGSPAAKAGLRPGDAFLEIDGKSVVPGTSSLISNKLKGPIDTDVQVCILPVGQTEPVEKTLTRANVVVDQVVYSAIYGDRIGYIRLSSFTDKSAADVRRAYERLSSSGKLKGLVLDLRGNTGGVLDGAIDIVGMFVPKGTKVMETKGRLPQSGQEYRTSADPISLDLPLTVLINGSSASASEIVAGSLQDLDRAVLIGSKSFGKGLVQSTRPTPYNGILKVTVARYYIPSGRCIQQLDYSHRNPDGSVAAVPDSLTKTFHTAAGRIVRDGGGIRPDIKVEDEVLTEPILSLSRKGTLFRYATRLAAERPAPKSSREISVSADDYEALVDTLEASHFTYGEMSAKALEQLRELADFEGYAEGSKAEFDALKAKLTPSLRRDIAPHKELVLDLLRGEMAMYYFGSQGYYAVMMETDPSLREAVKLLEDPQRYRELLTPKGKSDGKE